MFWILICYIVNEGKYIGKNLGEVLDIYWPVANEIFSESLNSFLFKELIVMREFI